MPPQVDFDLAAFCSIGQQKAVGDLGPIPHGDDSGAAEVARQPTSCALCVASGCSVAAAVRIVSEQDSHFVARCIGALGEMLKQLGLWKVVDS